MFRNDYSEPAAKEILAAVTALAGEQNVGYGEDVHCSHAKELIKDFFGVPDGDVHFLAGGTVTNMTVLSFLLRPYEAVIACETAHINVHETGAVEASGHKVYTVPSSDGKLTAEAVEKAFALHTDEHMVKPAAVYISDATETGTVYSRDELLALREVCDRLGLFLFLDGARLAPALVCGEGNVDAKLIGNVCDVFYAGGTKNGLLFGEAVVFRNRELSRCFRYHIKNRGAMLAKGFVTGAQFEALFTDGLFLRLAENAISTARLIRKELTAAGVEFVGASPTNQLFIRLPKDKAAPIKEKFGCELWNDLGDEEVIRIVTSFATTGNDCEELIGFIKTIL